VAIYSFKSLSPTSFFIAWKIEETFDALLLQLHPLFLADFSNRVFYSNKRAKQSLSVRVALAPLLEKLDLPIATLSTNVQGIPTLEKSHCYISFSHTSEVAVVALSTSVPIGVDVESIQLRLQKVQSKFLVDYECCHINNCLQKLTIAWSAKEALYKLLRRPLHFKDFMIEPFQAKQEGMCIIRCKQEKFCMHYKKIGDGQVLSTHFMVWSTSNPL